MKILKFKPVDIRILSIEEIKKKCQERMVDLTKTLDHKSYQYLRYVERYDLSQKERAPYLLFRMNELFNYNLKYTGLRITEDQYYDRIGQLPPKSFDYDTYKGSLVPECISDNVYEHLFKHKNVLYCVLMPTRLSYKEMEE